MALAGLAALGLGLATPASAANLIQDGNFEQAAPGAPFSSTTDYSVGQSIDGGFWTVTGGIVGVDTDNEFIFTGHKSVFLTDGSSGNSLTQILTTVPGQTYTISFFANADVLNLFQVSFGGIPVIGFPNSIPPFGFPGNFFQYTATATATGTNDALSFLGVAFPFGPFGFTVEIDQVSVYTASSVAPEPGGMTLVGLGAASLLVVRRFRKKPALVD